MRSGHKYGAVATVVDNVRFASKAEAHRYQELRVLERLGEVTELELQPKFPLYVSLMGSKTVAPCLGEYRADFRYRFGPQGLLKVEDVKGYEVPLQRWKRRHAEIQYGISVEVIRMRRVRGR